MIHHYITKYQDDDDGKIYAVAWIQIREFVEGFFFVGSMLCFCALDGELWVQPLVAGVGLFLGFCAMAWQDEKRR